MYSVKFKTISTKPTAYVSRQFLQPVEYDCARFIFLGIKLRDGINDEHAFDPSNAYDCA